MDDLDIATCEPRASELLDGLGFTPAMKVYKNHSTSYFYHYICTVYKQIWLCMYVYVTLHASMYSDILCLHVRIRRRPEHYHNRHSSRLHCGAIVLMMYDSFTIDLAAISSIASSCSCSMAGSHL